MLEDVVNDVKFVADDNDCCVEVKVDIDSELVSVDGELVEDNGKVELSVDVVPVDGTLVEEVVMMFEVLFTVVEIVDDSSTVEVKVDVESEVVFNDVEYVEVDSGVELSVAVEHVKSNDFCMFNF